MSTPLSSFPFFLISAFKLINIYVYKSSKSEGVSSAKEISNQWNGIWVIFSSADGLRRVGFMVDDAESARSGLPWTSFPALFI
jgi:hypothetical protein